ncbi:hypothetical protein BD408DRAFT_399080 [Parasitella parasitica]|nr:hypothetical protein BD408DRAFT_399080 [Parasitella parasitica]
MVFFTDYYKSPSVLKLLSITAISSSVWAAVRAQNDEYDDGSGDDGSEEGADVEDGSQEDESQESEGQDGAGQEDESQDDTATSSYNDGQWTPETTLTADTSLRTDPTIPETTTEAVIPSTITQDIQSTDISPNMATSTTASAIQSVTNSPEPQIDSPSPNKGAIAGGVVGGVVGVALIGALVFLLLRKKRAKSAADREVFTPQVDDDEYQDENLWRKSDSNSYPPPMSVASPTEPAPLPPQHTHNQNY